MSRKRNVTVAADNQKPDPDRVYGYGAWTDRFS